MRHTLHVNSCVGLLCDIASNIGISYSFICVTDTCVKTGDGGSMSGTWGQQVYIRTGISSG